MVLGRTVEAGTGEPAADVSVELLDAGDSVRITTFSDDSGHFAFVDEPGTYTLRATRLGYDTVRTRAITLEYGDVVELVIRLGTRPVALEPLVVTARQNTNPELRDYYRRVERNKQRLVGRILTRDDLKHFNAWTYEQVVRRQGLPFLPCPVVYWNGHEIPPDAMMPVSSIEGVEFYRPSEGPLRYRNPDPGCGVILVWSRPVTEGGPFSLVRLVLAAGAFLAVSLAAGIY